MPGQVIIPPPNSAWGLYDGDIGQLNGNATTAAGNCFLHRLTITQPVTINRLVLYINTSAGNFDAAIYSGTPATGLTRLFNIGSTASPGTGKQIITLGTAQTLAPGYYYTAFCSDSATAAICFESVATGLALPILVSSQTLPLPSSYTSGALGTNTTRKYGPVWLPNTVPGY